MRTIQMDKLKINHSYTRKELAELWGYKDYNAIRRGIFTPAGSHLIILFITRDKDKEAVQYQDSFDGKLLKMQGEVKHSNDKRLEKILKKESDEEIYLFYRETHQTPFIFEGKMRITKALLYQDRISEFEFFKL